MRKDNIKHIIKIHVYYYLCTLHCSSCHCSNADHVAAIAAAPTTLLPLQRGNHVVHAIAATPTTLLICRRLKLRATRLSVLPKPNKVINKQKNKIHCTSHQGQDDHEVPRKPLSITAVSCRETRMCFTQRQNISESLLRLGRLHLPQSSTNFQARASEWPVKMTVDFFEITWFNCLGEMLTLETKLADSKIRVWDNLGCWRDSPSSLTVTECGSGAVTWVSPLFTASIDASLHCVFSQVQNKRWRRSPSWRRGFSSLKLDL